MRSIYLLAVSACFTAACGPGTPDADDAPQTGRADAAVTGQGDGPGASSAASEEERLAAIEEAVGDADRPPPDRDRDESLMDDAGFELVRTSDVLRQPDVDRTQSFFAPEMRGRFTDRFVLLFRRR